MLEVVIDTVFKRGGIGKIMLVMKGGIDSQ